MASTNKTTNLELSQFLGTDKPAWLTDYNTDMQKIDDGFKKQANDINALDGRTTDLETGLGDSNTEIGTVKNDVQSLKDEDIIIKRDINTLTTNYDTIHHEAAVNAQSIEDLKLVDEQQNVEIQGIKRDYLPLRGGTINGNLYVKGERLELNTEADNRIIIRRNNITKGTPVEKTVNNSFVISDSNSSKILCLQSMIEKTGSQVFLESVDYLTGNNCMLILGCKNNIPYIKGVNPPADSNDKDVATTKWVRDLLVSLGISGAAGASSDGTESEGGV